MNVSWNPPTPLVVTQHHLALTKLEAERDFEI